jgi:predicted Zn finger-like uncharacterized protein
MNVSCSQCSTRYAIPDAKVRGRKVRLPCRRCGAPIIIDARSVPQGAASAPASGGAAPRPVNTPPATADDTWSVSVGGSVLELSATAIAEELRAERIGRGAYVWRSGMAAWQPLEKDPQLVRKLAAAGMDVSKAVGVPAPKAPSSSSQLADAAAALDDEATRIAESPLSTASSPRASAALADALPEDADEATTMYSAALHAPPAGLAEAVPEGDEEEATVMYSNTAHGARPVASTTRKTPTGGATAAEAVAGAPASVTELADALGEDDEEATVMFAGGDAPSAKVESSTRRHTVRPLARAESAAPIVPPPSTSSDDWVESSVVVEQDAPGENLARRPHAVTQRRRLPPVPAEVAEERTDTTQVAHRGRVSFLSIRAVVPVAALALAAGAAGYLISQRNSSPQSPTRPAPSELETPLPPPVQPTEVEAVPTAHPETTEPVALEQTPPVAEERESKRSRKPRTKSGVAEPGGSPTATVSAAAKPDTVPEEPPKEQPPFDAAAAKSALQMAARVSERECSRPGEPNGASVVSLSFANTGRAGGVSLRGPLSGTSTGLCILRKFSKVAVTPFSGAPVPMEQTLRIP